MYEMNVPNQCKENCQPQLKIFDKPLQGCPVKLYQACARIF